MKGIRSEPQWLLSGAFFLAGVFFGGLGIYIFLNISYPTLLKFHPVNSSYIYINPLLAVDVSQEKNLAYNKSLELGIKGLIDSRTQRGDIKNAAVYIRNLESGTWVGINEDDVFSPGKLLNIPIMIAYFKLGEGDPSLLNKKISFTGASLAVGASLPSNLFGQQPSEQLEKGKEYTIGELIRRMVVYNDNNAANLLFDYIDKSTLSEVYSDLGVDFRENKRTEDFISVKAYSLFFRVLYNATYLDRDSSERALSILSEVSNNSSLGAVFPKEMHVSESVGSREINGSDAVELYDCGIVYFPRHPYLFCAMARGSSHGHIEQWFQDVGHVLYNDIKYTYQA